MSWGPRIPPRLFALALIPIGGVAFFATQDISQEVSTTAEARGLLVDADSLESLWHATTAVNTELAIAGVVADSLGAGQVSDAHDVTTSEEVTRAQHATDHAIADLEFSHADAEWIDPDGVARLSEALQAVVGLRADAAAGSLTTDAVRDVARLAETAVVSSQVAQLREAHEVHGEDLVTALDASGNSISLIAAAADELRAIATALLAEPTDDGSRLLAELQSDVGAFDAAIAQFDQGLPASEHVEFADLRQTDPWLNYGRWRAAALDGDGARGSLVGKGDSLLAVGLERIGLIESFSDELVDGVAAHASDRERKATGELRSTLTVALTVLGFTAVACVVTARTIVRPLRRLENRARSISRGEVERDRKPTVGPADIVAVESAIDSLTDNLVVLEKQAAALAVGDLAAPVFDEVSPGRLGQSIQDSVQELRSLNSRLEYEANHDALTGLFNRAAIMSHLDRALTGRADARTPIAVVMVDLDGFKHANDTMGHHVGDELLCHVANRLSTTCAPHRVGRLGGDEFLIVVDGADDLVPLELAGRIVESLREPYATTEGTALLSAGAGIASSGGPTWLSPTEVLTRADLALREAKQSGRGELVVFDQRLHDRQFERMRIQGELRVALNREELQLHFQPIVDIASGDPVGVEALLRWFPPGRPPVPPSVFIAAAEQSELIVDIDNWVIREACRCLGTWADDPALAGLRMSINVSGRHLSSTDLVASVRRALGESNANPQLLIIEATETELIPNLDQAVEVLERLKDLGVTVAIDDFGTGYASVAHLRRADFGELKIDRTFIANLDSVTDRSIADLLVSLGRDLQLDVVAEGIETSDQLAWAKAAGCTHAQGFFLARPEPEEDMRDSIVQLRATFSPV